MTINPLRYIGGYNDGNGIYKLGARYYDTAQGRFTQMDPSGQEKNPFAYATCNPVNGRDPSGLATTCDGAIYAYLGATGATITAVVAGLFTGGWALVGGIVGGIWTGFSIPGAAEDVRALCNETEQRIVFGEDS